MGDDLSQTLFLPLDRGIVPLPGGHDRALLFGAGRGFRLPLGSDREAFDLVQPFRPDYLALGKSGFAVHPVPPPGRYGSAWIIAGRHRSRNELWIDKAVSRLRPGGWLVVAGALKGGGDSLAKRLKRRFPQGERFSKHHGVVFHAAMTDLAGYERDSDLSTSTADGWTTAPGAFSSDHVDPASRLLVRSLPGDVSGRVADLGAGWGYLSGEIVERFPAVCHVDLYEADFLALQAAKDNLARRAETAEAGFFWQDIVAEPIERRYDTIVMNPPFHEARAADPSLGQAFIMAAAKALKPGGRLFLVANTGLPYEATLARTFHSHGETTREGPFKVLWARR